jgi:hypothetical protein
LFWAAALSLPIPPLLNLYWYSILVKGALKSLGLIKGSDKKKRGEAGALGPSKQKGQ